MASRVFSRPHDVTERTCAIHLLLLFAIYVFGCVVDVQRSKTLAPNFSGELNAKINIIARKYFAQIEAKEIKHYLFINQSICRKQADAQ